MKAFEKTMQRYSDRINKPVHTVIQYSYTIETSRERVLTMAERDKNISFSKLFEIAENRVQAIFMFLSILELVQQNFLSILIGEGKNNFILEYVSPGDRDPEIEVSDKSSFE